REGFERESGVSQTSGELGHTGAGPTREAGDPEGEHGARDQEPHGRAAAEPALAGREQPPEPRDWMVAVRRIAESEVDRERDQQNDGPRDLGAQRLGNESPASLATASMSTARATASASSP